MTGRVTTPRDEIALVLGPSQRYAVRCGEMMAQKHGNGCTSTNIVVVLRKCNYQRGQYARSKNSVLRCVDCGWIWSTKRSTRGLRTATDHDACGPIVREVV